MFGAASLAYTFHRSSKMPPFLAPPGFLSYSLPNDNIFSCSNSVYAFDSSFGMDRTQDSFPQRSSQSSQLQPTEPPKPAINQQSTGISLEEEPEELAREPFSSNHTCDHSKNQSATYQVPSNTPMVCQVASFRHFLPSAAPAWGRVSAWEMVAYLAIELNGVKPTKIVNLPNMIFPNSSLPFPVDESLLLQLKNVWDLENRVLNPPVAYTEEAIQNWFNAIGNNIASIHHSPPRYWSAKYCNTVLPDNELARKPDDILIETTISFLSIGGVYTQWPRSLHALFCIPIW